MTRPRRGAPQVPAARSTASPARRQRRRSAVLRPQRRSPHAQPTRGAQPRRPASASTRPTCAGAWRERLRGAASSTRACSHAIATVPRHRFVDTALVTQAYEDTSLPIGHGQTISKPSVVARMIELLLGGANARRARAARRACSRSAPAAATRRRCWRAGAAGDLGRAAEAAARQGARAAGAAAARRSLRLVFGDGMLGHPPGAPYDSIIAAAGGDDVARRPGSSSSPSAAGWSRRSSRPGGGRRWSSSIGTSDGCDRTRSRGGAVRPLKIRACR